MISLSKVIDYEKMLDISKEFCRLRERCYLENAGAALYPASLLRKVNEDLTNNVYMNPHSDKYTKDCIEQIRCLILKHFNTDPSNYTVIFTSGTTQSLKLVLESFQFMSQEDEQNQGSFVYLRDNHTSVIGLREIAKEKNVDVIHISQEEFLKSVKNTRTIQPTIKNENRSNSLLAYPAQNNFNGFKYPLNCIENIKNGCLNNYLKKQLCETNCNWYILLDAAAYVSTNKLDLSEIQPDFVCLSFYKIFGYPTGLGALIVKNTSIPVLSDKKYFGGGTVDIVLTSEDFHVKRETTCERYEDGTVPFLSILALKHCFDTLYSLIPTIVENNVMETISHHTFYLAQDFFKQLINLKHENGNKAAHLYMDSDFTDLKTQGSIVAFNIKRKDGSFVGYAEHMADLFNISVRTGCFCNSGTCQRHLNVSNKNMKAMFKAGHKCGDDIDLLKGKPTGAIRVSFGYYNTYRDVDKLIYMICKCFVNSKIEKPLRTMNIYKKSQNGLLPSRIIYKKKEESHLNNNNSILYPQKSGIVLTEMAIFPIKSCGAFKINSKWKIGPKGFQFDREWMVVKDNGVCLTQKQCTLMCTIRPEINLESRCLILNCQDMPSISIPLDHNMPKDKYEETSLCHSKVCTDIIKGFDCGDDVADWVSNALGISFLRLIRQSSDDTRSQKKRTDGNKLLSLSNQAQFLLVNKATVKWLRGKIDDPLFSDDLDSLTDRFRGNLIIDMSQELAEKEWHRVIIGDHEFSIDGQCPRCQMVCIDQKTGQKTVEPLRTIAEQFEGKLRFGIYLSYIGPVHGSKSSTLDRFACVVPIYNDSKDGLSR